jgi:hypothetical protein
VTLSLPESIGEAWPKDVVMLIGISSLTRWIKFEVGGGRWDSGRENGRIVHSSIVDYYQCYFIGASIYFLLILSEKSTCGTFSAPGQRDDHKLIYGVSHWCCKCRCLLD